MSLLKQFLLAYLVVGHTALLLTSADNLWKHWDSPIASVMQQSKLIFNTVMDLHRILVLNTEGVPEFLRTLACKILDLSWEHRAKFAPLVHCCIFPIIS